MILFTATQKQKLLENGKCDDANKDFPPVVKLAALGTNAIWLLSEINPEYPHIAFGLCDLGVGFPELGYVDIREILEASIVVFNDATFIGKYPLTIYARAARAHDAIVWDDETVGKYQTN